MKVDVVCVLTCKRLISKRALRWLTGCRDRQCALLINHPVQRCMQFGASIDYCDASGRICIDCRTLNAGVAA